MPHLFFVVFDDTSSTYRFIRRPIPTFHLPIKVPAAHTHTGQFFKSLIHGLVQSLCSISLSLFYPHPSKSHQDPLLRKFQLVCFKFSQVSSFRPKVSRFQQACSFKGMNQVSSLKFQALSYLQFHIFNLKFQDFNKLTAFVVILRLRRHQRKNQGS